MRCPYGFAGTLSPLHRPMPSSMLSRDLGTSCTCSVLSWSFLPRTARCPVAVGAPGQPRPPQAIRIRRQPLSTVGYLTGIYLKVMASIRRRRHPA
jgi:hypothetical protein